MVMAMLVICPNRRMVATVPEAMPKCLLSTALIIAFMLGDENRENPKPRKARVKTMNTVDVSAPIKTKENSPMAVIAIPADAIRRGSTLSESLRRKKRHYDRLGNQDRSGILGSDVFDILQIQAQQKCKCECRRVVNQCRQTGKSEQFILLEQSDFKHRIRHIQFEPDKHP